MFCSKCGAALIDDRPVCPVCGASLSLSSSKALQTTDNTKIDLSRGSSALSKQNGSGQRIQKINPTVYVAPELQGNLRRAERSRGIGIIALFFSVFCPPLGTLLGAVASAKADKGLKISQSSAKCRSGRIMGITAIVISIITIFGVLYLFSGMLSCLSGCMMY